MKINQDFNSYYKIFLSEKISSESSENNMRDNLMIYPKTMKDNSIKYLKKEDNYKLSYTN